MGKTGSLDYKDSGREQAVLHFKCDMQALVKTPAIQQNKTYFKTTNKNHKDRRRCTMNYRMTQYGLH